MFLDHFQRHCPTDERNTYVDFVREGACGAWQEVIGDPCWLRVTEMWTATAKSVFLFDVQGAVAKASYAGIPWLRYLRSQSNGGIHFWPFDGWEVPVGRSVIAEGYPVTVDEALSKAGSEQRSARSLLGGRMASPCRPEWDSHGVLPASFKSGGVQNRRHQELGSRRGLGMSLEISD